MIPSREKIIVVHACWSVVALHVARATCNLGPQRVGYSYMSMYQKGLRDRLFRDCGASTFVLVLVFALTLVR